MITDLLKLWFRSDQMHHPQAFRDQVPRKRSPSYMQSGLGTLKTECSLFFMDHFDWSCDCGLQQARWRTAFQISHGSESSGRHCFSSFGMNLNVAASCYDYNDFNAQHRLVLMLLIIPHDDRLAQRQHVRSAVGPVLRRASNRLHEHFSGWFWPMMDDSFETLRFIWAVILADRPKPY